MFVVSSRATWFTVAVMAQASFSLALIASAALAGCGGDEGGASERGATGSGATKCAPGDISESPAHAGEVGVAHEILNILSPNEFIVWLSTEITRAEFDALELPQGWIKNNPLEGQPDSGKFFRSPDASMDGPLTMQEHFGHVWVHPATVVEVGVPLDDEGLLAAARVAKFHELTYNACRKIALLVSPEGDIYVRVSRDANRTTDTFLVPTGWDRVDHVTQSDLVLQLPNPTLVIRAQNQDSFQGPVSGIDIEQ